MRQSAAWRWLVDEYQWPHAALFGAVCLLALAPFLYRHMQAALLLVYMQLPVYMVHQAEEHFGDRFRLELNRLVAAGRDALTREAAFWINSVLVWVPLLAAVYLRGFWWLFGSYLLLVNALIHMLTAAVTRRYNPGLTTAILLLLPLGWATLLRSAVPFHLHSAEHLRAAGLVFGVHAGILVHVRMRSRAMTGGTRAER